MLQSVFYLLVELKVYVAVYIVWSVLKIRKVIFFNFEKTRNKDAKDGILNYATPIKVNEREK
jgi:hypothetical protein